MVTGKDLLDSKILIVDDSKENVRLLESLLKSVGYHNIEKTTDPREVVDLYKNSKSDLVLLDLNMPHLDGFQVMEQLLAIEKDSYASIMILTAQSDQASRIKALEAGAQDFLSKPFDLIEVNLRIKNMLEIKHLNKMVLQNNQNLEKAVHERTLELQERSIELEETRMETIYRLGRAAEFRDNDTGMHVVRMSRYSGIIAQGFGLEKKECELILNASPMHDIGKIGIPDRVLLKNGKLTAEEWEIMKTHSKIGAQILSRGKHTLTKAAKTIALCHHEKWDGSGYPNGLNGTNIPLPARIVSIADCFDALTSERPYKVAWAVEDAVKEMDRVTGTSFDPELMKVFHQVLPEILKTKNDLPDEERRSSESEA
ncbi:MAG: response regulator [Nitrospinae bacterium]|nr:response regulator [Nitrospinota bacterium]